jgi:DNA-binding MurR/RpiR family transcriptional regulator
MNSDLIKAIREKLPNLSKSHKIIAKYVIEHPDSAAYLTATKLGAVSGVSEPTVVRFAIEMGFKGYPEMQKALKEQMRTSMTSVQRVAAADSIISDGDVLSKIMNSDAEKIKMTLSEVKREDFDRAVKMITEAKNVYIMGIRSASMLASFFAYHLNIILNNVTILDMTSAGEMLERLMWITEDDVFIGISFPRYSKRTRNAVEFARKRGANILALTDSIASPIAEKADCTLIAKSDMASFVDSLVAPLSIINAITVAVSMNKKEQLSGHLNELEKIWDEYEVYEKTN